MNYSLCLVLSVICVTLAVVSAAPRTKRFTCTFIGEGGCEAHCYLLNRQGGWCDDRNVCNCRSEQIFGRDEEPEERAAAMNPFERKLEALDRQWE